MNKHAWWALAAKNSVVIICWTAIAIYFGKWWIALFGLLGFTYLKTRSDGSEEDG